MKHLMYFLVILTLSTFSFGTASGQSGGITLDSVSGLWGSSSDTILVEQPITFFLRVTGDYFTAYVSINNGFRFYSPNGAQWDTTTGDTLGPIGQTQFDWGFYINSFGTDGSGEDTVFFGGMAFSGTGLPVGFDSVAYSITIGPIASTYHGRQICFDSTYVPPGTPWTWLYDTESYTPTWDGPHCFTIFDPSHIAGDLWYVSQFGDDSTGDGGQSNPFGTIQHAINMAGPHDTVIVGAGTFTGAGNRDIDFHGKPLVVKSISGPGSSIIDCEGSVGNNRRGFVFHTGEDSSHRVEQVSITNGYHEFGGAVHCDFNSSPTFVDCHFFVNYAQYKGGAIYSINSSPVLVGCTFDSNGTFQDKALAASLLQEQETGARSASPFERGSRLDYVGGAISCDSGCLWLTNCTFNTNYAEQGGALSLEDVDTAQIFGCSFNWNEGYQGATIYASGPIIYMDSCETTGDISTYGSLYLYGTWLNMNSCEFTAGHDIVFLDAGHVNAEYCTFADNSGTPLTISGSGLNMTDVLFADNGSSLNLVGVSGTLTNCTIVRNGATAFPAQVNITEFGVLTIDNSIIAFSDSSSGHYPVAAVACLVGSEATLHCCDVYGNNGGDWAYCIASQADSAGNFSANPYFCDTSNGDYELFTGSPCMPAYNDCSVLVGARPAGCDVNPYEVEITRPISQEPVFIDWNYVIMWSKGEAVSTVNIELSRDNGSNWETLASDHPGSTYVWYVMGDTSSTAQINIYDAANPGPSRGNRDIRGFPIFPDPMGGEVEPIQAPAGDPVSGDPGTYDDTLKKAGAGAAATDLAVIYTNGTVQVFFGLQGGGLDSTGTTVLTLDSGLIDLETADINRDGVLDLIVANAVTYGVSVHLGNGDGTFSSAPGYIAFVDAPLVDIGLDDFDRDGNLDLWAAVGQPVNAVAVFLIDSSMNVDSVTTLPLIGAPHAGASADFDGDGLPDIAVVGGLDGRVSVYAGIGDGTFTPQFFYTTGWTAGAMVVSYFDRNSTPDIGIAYSDASARFATLLNNGSGSFDIHSFSTELDGHSSVAVADITGNGAPDVLIGSAANDALILLPGIPSEPDSAWNGFGYPLVVDAGDGPVDLSTADFTADGLPDIIVLNAGSQDGLIMDGTITPGVSTSLTVASPNGGEELHEGAGYDITWTAGEGILAVDVQVSRNGGTTWETMAANRAGTSFAWSVWGPATTQGLVRVYDPTVSSRTDISDGLFTIALGCCTGIRGNIDYDPGDVIDISDLVFLVDFMFVGGPAPQCFEEADVNASGGLLDIADLVYTVDYMFGGGPAPADCP